MFDEDTLKLARELAECAGLSLSAWLARAVEIRIKVEDGLRGVAEYEAEYGPISEDAHRRADEWLDSIGVPRVPE